MTDGSVKCWGRNHYGQLGLGDLEDRGDEDGEMGDALPYVDLGSNDRAEAVTASPAGTCALLEGGSVKCWGYNGYGQLGQGHVETIGDEPGEMGDALPAIDLGTGRRAIEVDSGSTFTCALLDDGAVKCWGENEANFFQLGLPTAGSRGSQPGQMGDALPEVPLGSDVSVVTVSAGAAHGCAVLEGGGLKCWGHGSEHPCDSDPTFPCNVGPRWGGGRLGYGDMLPRGHAEDMGDNLPLVDVGTDEKVVAVDAGLAHTCALLEGGRIKCWGAGEYNTLGNGTVGDIGDEPGEMGDALPYTDLGTGLVVEAFASFYIVNCALFETGKVKCWGGTENGYEMGDALPYVELPE